MLCDQHYRANETHYRGLDSNRDTIEEVKFMAELFPHLLSRRKNVLWDYRQEERIPAENDAGEFPIQCVTYLPGTLSMDRCNLKAVPFASTLASVGNEENQFEEEQRGGLLVKDSFYETSALQRLAR